MMKRSGGGGRRLLLCIYVPLHQSKSIQTLSQCHELRLFQMRVMMSALIYIWKEKNEPAKLLTDWSTGSTLSSDFMAKKAILLIRYWLAISRYQLVQLCMHLFVTWVIIFFFCLMYLTAVLCCSALINVTQQPTASFP